MRNARNAGKRKPQKTTKGRPKRRRPALRFTPYAWAKLLFLRDLDDTEVGGFAISSDEQFLLVEDVRLVRQSCTPVSVTFDDASVADFFDEQVDQGRHPEQFARVWLHTHPGECPTPSGTDQETFRRCFGKADWSVMFILARTGQTYARLRFNAGPGGSLRIPVEVDYGRPFRAADHAAWEAEYRTNVRVARDSFGFGWEEALHPCDTDLSPDVMLMLDELASPFQPHGVERRDG